MIKFCFSFSSRNEVKMSVTMGSYFVIVISLLTATAISSCYGESDADAYLSRLIADMWLEGADVVRIIWRDCSKKVRLYNITACFSIYTRQDSATDIINRYICPEYIWHYLSINYYGTVKICILLIVKCKKIINLNNI